MGKKMIWETPMKSYIKRTELLVSNTRAIYAIVWGECSPMMQAKLESLDSFDDKSDKFVCIWILKETQGITHHFEGTRNVFISLDDAWSSYYSYRQSFEQTLHEYLKDFQGLVQVLKHYGAAFGANFFFKTTSRQMSSRVWSPHSPTKTFWLAPSLQPRPKPSPSASLTRLIRKSTVRYEASWRIISPEDWISIQMTSRVPTTCY